MSTTRQERRQAPARSREFLDALELSPDDADELLRLAESGLLRSGDELVVSALARRFGVGEGKLRAVAARLGGATERALWEGRARAITPSRRFGLTGTPSSGLPDDPIAVEAAAGDYAPDQSHPADDLLR